MRSSAMRGSGTRFGLMLLASMLACNGPGPGGGNGETGTTGGTGSGTGSTLHLDAGGAGAFGPIALAAAGNEAELFFSQATDGGYAYRLQHLTPAGKAVMRQVEVATGTPTAPPIVAVSSDGTEIACCWEDWGRLDPLSHTAGEVTRCNSVPVTGAATDLAMDGGFGDLGSKPVLAHGAKTTGLAYAQANDAWISETILYFGSAVGETFIAPFNAFSWQLTPVGTGFDLFVSDGGALEFSAQQYELRNDGSLKPVPDGVSSGSYAAATSSLTAASAVTAALVHQGSSVVATLVGAATPTAMTVSAATESPLDPVAAAACDSLTFGFAYALAGGSFAFREMTTAGAPGNGEIIAASLGGDITTLAMTPVDGGVLIAAGTSTDIAVYALPCP